MPQLATVDASGVDDAGVAFDGATLGDIDECELDRYLAPCVDSTPLPGDVAVCVETTDVTGDLAATGYSVECVTAPGEGRFFSRDPATGSTAANLWCRNDGSVVIESGTHLPSGCAVEMFPDGALSLSNALGAISLSQSGAVTINGVVFSPAGSVSGVTSLAATSVVASGSVSAPVVTAGLTSLGTHTHNQSPPAPLPAVTLPPNPG